jgi:hypothetical protein
MVRADGTDPDDRAFERPDYRSSLPGKFVEG